MGCLINIAGKNLDIDEFISKTNLKGFVKRYKDQNSPSKSNKLGKQYSFVCATISEAELQDFEKQISDAILYLRKNRKKLALINSIKGVEYATINFMVLQKLVSKKYFAQYIYLPKELVALCGSLNLGIEVAIV